MEKKQTALMQAIEIIQNRCIDLSIVDDADNPHARNDIKEHEATIELLRAKLPVEREQIEDAWQDANGHSFYEYSKDYFNETYTQE